MQPPGKTSLARRPPSGTQLPYSTLRPATAAHRTPRSMLIEVPFGPQPPPEVATIIRPLRRGEQRSSLAEPGLRTRMACPRGAAAWARGSAHLQGLCPPVPSLARGPEPSPGWTPSLLQFHNKVTAVWAPALVPSVGTTQPSPQQSQGRLCPAGPDSGRKRLHLTSRRTAGAREGRPQEAFLRNLHQVAPL